MPRLLIAIIAFALGAGLGYALTPALQHPTRLEQIQNEEIRTLKAMTATYEAEREELKRLIDEERAKRDEHKVPRAL